MQSKSARLPAFIQGLASVKLHRRMREAYKTVERIGTAAFAFACERGRKGWNEGPGGGGGHGRGRRGKGKQEHSGAHCHMISVVSDETSTIGIVKPAHMSFSENLSGKCENAKHIVQ